MKNIFFLCLFLLISFACSLSSKQEKTLNKSLVIYLKSIEENNPLIQTSLTHPDFLKYIYSKGDNYFLQIFGKNYKEEHLEIMFPVIRQVKFDKNNIHVLFELKKEYISEGVNHVKPVFYVAISEDNGKTWFFVNIKLYRNKKICKKIKRLLK